jgi:hypothetical protein
MVAGSPASFRELIEHCREIANGRWGIWEVVDGDRHLFYGRQLRHWAGLALGTRKKRPWHFDVVCARCGRGWQAKSWEWAKRPTGYTPRRWISLCFHCLSFWVSVWPEIFPRFRLGVALLPQWFDDLPDGVGPIDRLAFHTLPPFGG